MNGFGAWGEFPWGAVTNVVPVTDDPALVAMLQAPVVEQCYLASLFLLSGVADSTGNDGPWCSAPWGVLPWCGANSAVSSGVVEHGYSSAGYTSKLADSPSNTHYEGRLRQPITFSRGIEGTERLSGMMDLSGDIEIENGDGALDQLFEQYFSDGRAVRTRIGRSANALSTFGDLFIGRIAFTEAFTERVVVGVSDGMIALRKPIQTNMYLGTGGLEGGDDLKGRPKPLAFGYVFNISPPLVDAASLIYQVSDGSIQDVPEVFDRGVLLTKVPSAPTLGQYAVDTALGTYRLGGAPAGTVTCNVQGSVTPNFAASTADIIRRIIMTYGLLADSEIESSSFSSAVGYASADVGIWTGTDPVLITDVIAELLAGVGGYAGFNRFGRFEFGVLDDPVSAISAELTAENIKSFERIPLPSAINPLVWRVSVGYQKNYTVQNDFAGSVSDARKTFAAQPFRVAPPVQDLNIKSRRLLAQEITVPGLFRFEADALGEAQRLFRLFSEPRSLYRMTLSMAGILVGFGDVVNITFPRYGLNSGKLGTVVGQRFDAAMGESELTVFV